MAYNNNYNRGGGKPKGGSPSKKIQYPLNKDFYNPYTFVPFANYVYSLDENEEKELSAIHDIPVKGALSGRITVDFEAQTAFCVRKGTDEYSMNIDGSYYVPGTTIKGMIRSVFDILTFANARNGIVNNRYSMRDLRNKDYELKANDKPQTAGFLLRIKGKNYIHKCKYYDAWRYEDIEDYTGKNGLKQKRKVSEKYRFIDRFTYDEDDNPAMWLFSGFMNNKEHEFMLTIPEFSNQELIPIQNEEWDDFIFIHEKENANEAWKYWRGIIKNYDSVSDINKDNKPAIVPCFFRCKKGTNEVRDLGFSFLYRQPYNKKIHDFLPSAHKSSGIDLGEAVFGYVKKDKALKGRIAFGSAFIENATRLGRQTFIMGSPKPTYYPFYLQQNDRNGEKLNTYFNNSILSGAKRYVLQSEEKKGEEKPCSVTTSFYPLDKGAQFTSCISFHNLHDYELGALLAAITFCNKPECFHSMGFAKPFGYGRMKVTGCKVTDCDKTDIDDLIRIFKEKITSRCNIEIEEWEKSVHKLFKIASTVTNDKDKVVRYPIMDHKEFENIKNKKYSLSDFEL